MEKAQESNAEEKKETNSKENTKGPECLKVCVRVRPRLKQEFLKETATFVDPNVTETNYSVGQGNKNSKWRKNF